MAVRKAADILKADGYTDAEIAELNPKFLKSIDAAEVERDRLATEHARLTKDIEDTTRWYNETATPTLNRALNDATNAKAEAARVNARLKAAQEYGLAKIADDQYGINDDGKPPKKQDDGAPDARYVTQDVFSQTADQFGTAIAMATDIAEEYRDLHGGKRLPGGVQALRNEYIEARTKRRFEGTMQDFADQKFGFAAKRSEIAKQEEDKRIDGLVSERYNQRISESGNPMTRVGTISRNPFTQKVTGDSVASGKQPWERGTVEQRRGERVVGFSRKVMEKSA